MYDQKASIKYIALVSYMYSTAQHVCHIDA